MILIKKLKQEKLTTNFSCFFCTNKHLLTTNFAGLNGGGQTYNEKKRNEGNKNAFKNFGAASATGYQYR